MSKLTELCSHYIWHVLVGWDLEGYDYTGNLKRAEIHGKIGDVLGIEEIHGGYLKWALNNLESSASLPSEIPDYNDWEPTSRRCGSTLARNLIRTYGTKEEE